MLKNKIVKEAEAATRGDLLKKALLKNFTILTGKHLCWSFFLIKLQALRLHEKEIPTQVFSCEYCEIFKDTYFEEHLRTTASAETMF